jgi:hypothetical protein
MEAKEVVEILEQHNKWRRESDGMTATDPKKLGVAIDHVVKYLPMMQGVATVVVEQRQKIMALRHGNTKLIEALMAMVEQFFYSQNEQGQHDENGEIFIHRFMSAEEMAIATLIEAGFAEEVEKGKNGYRLRNDLLEYRLAEFTPDKEGD